MFCVKCGNSLPDGDSFCGKCGAAQGSGVPTSGTPTAAAVQPAKLSVPPPKPTTMARDITIVVCLILSVMAMAMFHGFAAFLAICSVWFGAFFLRSKSSAKAKLIFVGSALAVVLVTNGIEGWQAEREAKQRVEQAKLDAKRQKEAIAAEAQAKAQQAEKAKQEFAAMTPEQHLAKAKEIMVPYSAGPLTIAEGNRHLAAIPTNSTVAREAAAFKRQFEVEKKKYEAQAARDAKIRTEQQRKIQIALREAVTKKMEESMLDEGYNCDITATGPDKTTLRIKYVLASKVFAHHLSKNGEFFEQARQMGFKKVYLTDGYNFGWEWTL